VGAGVDVLAVMTDAYWSLQDAHKAEALREARAAVAELIEALDEYVALPTYVTLDCRSDGEGDDSAWWSRRRSELEAAGYSFVRENYNDTEDFVLAGVSDRIVSAHARAKGAA
jgi:hypothetical protein